MSFYLFRRYLLSKRSGSLIKLVSRLCLAGVAVSISALFLIISVMEGFGKAIKSRLLDKQAHLSIEFDKNPFAKINKKEQEGLFIDNKNKDLFFLNQKQKNTIKSSQVFETQEVILNFKKEFKGVSVRGFSEQTWKQKKQQAIESPANNLTLFEKSDLQNPSFLKVNSKKYILISSNLALETNLSKGDTVTVLPLGGLLLPPQTPPPVKLFEVAGILPSEANSLTSIYHQEGNMDFGEFSNIYYKAEIQLKEPEKILEQEKLFQNYNVQNWMKQNSYLFFALKLEKFMMILFFTIALIISCLGLSSSLFLLMTQKTEDIAILQALGVSQKKIVQIFTNIGLYLSSLGLTIGAVIGLSTVLFLKYNHINILPEMYQDRTIPAIFTPSSYFIILLGTFCLSWIFCYFPSRRFSKIHIANILKSKGL